MDQFLPVADQLRILFEAVLHPDGRPYTLQEVGDATGISLGTISQLRNGRIKNPQFNTLVGLSRFFRVPLRYFESKTTDECYTILSDSSSETVDKSEIGEIAFRATHLSPEGQRDLLTVLKWIQAAEKQGDEHLSLLGLEHDEDLQDEAH